MSTKSTFSIGIPAFNQGVYLRSTIESVLNQTTRATEIVVSNNWSTDSTKEVAESFGDRIRLITPPKHLSMMEHWNFVVSELSGDWFSLLSSDDEAKPNFVDTLSRGAVAFPSAVMVRSGYDIIDGDGRLIDTRYILSAKKITKPPQTLYEQLTGPKASFAAFALRKATWDMVGGFPDTMNLNGDWGMWLKVSPHGDFIYEHDIISRYRTQYRPGLNVKRLLAELKDDVIIYEDIMPSALKQVSNPNTSKLMQASKTRFLNRLILLNDIEDPELREAARDILEPWAASTGNEDILKRALNGEKIQPQSRPWFFKSTARKIYQWARRQ